ncbi:hypothetical protein C8R47DRAFT_1023226 [Mycena vitilis]|nr:hypothetical protein C8R47DRAFT_1023226 [Mycena vitilis]
MACWNCGATSDSDSLHPIPSISPIQHLMKANDPPSAVEITVLRDFTTNASRRVDALDARIEILKITMEQLTSERDNLARQVEECGHLLSPIRRVPPEILCEIFSWVSPHSKRIAGSATEAPWYLGHISRSWRETARAFHHSGPPSAFSTLGSTHTTKSRLLQWSRLSSTGPPMPHCAWISCGSL